jgi:hypothetical protein
MRVSASICSGVVRNETSFIIVRLYAGGKCSALSAILKCLSGPAVSTASSPSILPVMGASKGGS